MKTIAVSVQAPRPLEAREQLPERVVDGAQGRVVPRADPARKPRIGAARAGERAGRPRPVRPERREAPEELLRHGLVGHVVVHLVGVEKEEDRLAAMLVEHRERLRDGQSRPASRARRTGRSRARSRRPDRRSRRPSRRACGTRRAPRSTRASRRRRAVAGRRARRRGGRPVCERKSEACEGSVQLAAGRQVSARSQPRKNRSSLRRRRHPVPVARNVIGAQRVDVEEDDGLARAARCGSSSAGSDRKSERAAAPGFASRYVDLEARRGRARRQLDGPPVPAARHRSQTPQRAVPGRLGLGRPNGARSRAVPAGCPDSELS